MPTRGVVYVHSAPLAVCPHVEWAIARVLASPVRLQWSAQPADPAPAAPSAPGPAGPAPAPSSPPPCGAGRCSASRSPRSPARATTASASCTCPAAGCSGPRSAWPATSWSPRTRCGPSWRAARGAGGAGPRPRPAARHRLGRRAGAVPARRRRRAGDLAHPGQLTRRLARRPRRARTVSTLRRRVMRWRRAMTVALTRVAGAVCPGLGLLAARRAVRDPSVADPAAPGGAVRTAGATLRAARARPRPAGRAAALVADARPTRTSSARC